MWEGVEPRKKFVKAATIAEGRGSSQIVGAWGIW
jgi:hypothetical protein